MTHYHFANQQNKKTTSRKKIVGVILGVVIISGVLIFLLSSMIQRIAQGPAWARTTLEQSIEYGISNLTPKKNIIAQNVLLQEKIANYEAQLIELKILQDENKSLRNELSYLDNPQSMITARIIQKPNQSLHNQLIIDRGSRDEIMVGKLVVTAGVLGIGRVVSVTETTATVQLFSSPEFSGDMVIKYQNITVPTIGKGGGSFEIHIPREIVVTDGDILTFPNAPQIAIAIVKSIQFDPRDPFQTILARAPVNIQELRFVEVLK